ncbi:MAG: helix-turn-helix transcriptional regulator, partial [Polyangiales bacterium]
AFVQRRVWKQTELAKQLEVSTEVIRRVLHELREKGMPLDREEDHPHVYWTVPKDWFPGSVLFKREEIPELLRQLRRIPHGKGRAQLLDLVLGRTGNTAPPPPGIVPRAASEQEEQYLSSVEDALGRKTALFMRYYTASRGAVGDRHVSVQRIHIGPPARLVAWCHRSEMLKTFRVDGIVSARLDAQERFHPVDEAAVDAYDKASLDGFNQGGTPTKFSFVVRDPEARWVRNNLLDGMRAEDLTEGIRVEVTTTSLVRLARFVVGLGGAATCETPALAGEVATLARGALAAAGTSV